MNRSQISRHKMKQNIYELERQMKQQKQRKNSQKLNTISSAPLQQNCVNTLEKNKDYNKKLYQPKKNIQQNIHYTFERNEKKFQIAQRKQSSSIINVQYIKQKYQLQKYDQIIEILKQRYDQIMIQNSIAKKQNIPILNLIQKQKKQANQIFFLYIGNCLYKLRKYDEALQYYKKLDCLLFTNQNRIKLKNNFAICFWAKCKNEASLQILNELLIDKTLNNEQQVAILYNIGLINMQTAMFRSSQQFFIESIKKNRRESTFSNKIYTNCHLNLGICLKKMERYSESLEYLTVAYQNGNKYSIKQICQVLQQTGNLDQALNLYQQMIDNFGGNSFWEKHIYIKVCQIYKKMKNYRLVLKYQIKQNKF